MQTTILNHIFTRYSWIYLQLVFSQRSDNLRAPTHAYFLTKVRKLRTFTCLRSIRNDTCPGACFSSHVLRALVEYACFHTRIAHGISWLRSRDVLKPGCYLNLEKIRLQRLWTVIRFQIRGPMESPFREFGFFSSYVGEGTLLTFDFTVFSGQLNF